LGVKDIMAVPITKRGQEWYEGLTALYSAAYKQAWTEIMTIPLMEIGKNHVKELNGLKFDKSLLHKIEERKKAHGKEA